MQDIYGRSGQEEEVMIDWKLDMSQRRQYVVYIELQEMNDLIVRLWIRSVHTDGRVTIDDKGKEGGISM